MIGADRVEAARGRLIDALTTTASRDGDVVVASTDLATVLAPHPTALEAHVDRVLAAVRAELLRACANNGPMRSTHEGYAVLAEEVDELWDDVKANRYAPAAEEAVQVAAMGARFLLDLGLPAELRNADADGWAA